MEGTSLVIYPPQQRYSCIVLCTHTEYTTTKKPKKTLRATALIPDSPTQIPVLPPPFSPWPDTSNTLEQERYTTSCAASLLVLCPRTPVEPATRASLALPAFRGFHHCSGASSKGRGWDSVSIVGVALSAARRPLLPHRSCCRSCRVGSPASVFFECPP